MTPVIMTGTNVYASENESSSQITLWDIEDETNPIYDTKPISDNNQENVTVEYTNEGPIVTVYEDDATVSELESGRVKRADVYRWGGWEYTNIAISTGVLAGMINTGFSGGVTAVAASIGLPAAAIGRLLTVAGWTNLGNSPGKAVAENWDKNGNGWVGFYYQRGYDAAGRVVATQYKTE